MREKVNIKGRKQVRKGKCLRLGKKEGKLAIKISGMSHSFRLWTQDFLGPNPSSVLGSPATLAKFLNSSLMVRGKKKKSSLFSCLWSIQHLEQCLAHSINSKHSRWINEWIHSPSLDSISLAIKWRLHQNRLL